MKKNFFGMPWEKKHSAEANCSIPDRPWTPSAVVPITGKSKSLFFPFFAFVLDFYFSPSAFLISTFSLSAFVSDFLLYSVQFECTQEKRLQSISLLLRTTVEYEGKSRPLKVEADKMQFTKKKFEEMSFDDEILYTLAGEKDIIGATSHKIRHEIILTFHMKSSVMSAVMPVTITNTASSFSAIRKDFKSTILREEKPSEYFSELKARKLSERNSNTDSGTRSIVKGSKRTKSK